MRFTEIDKTNLQEIDLHQDEDLGESGIVPIRRNGVMQPVPVKREEQHDDGSVTYMPVFDADFNAVLNDHILADPEIDY